MHGIYAAIQVVTATATLPKAATAPNEAPAATMMALVYLGDGKKGFEERPKPGITAPTDAIVKIVKTTICGTGSI